MPPRTGKCQGRADASDPAHFLPQTAVACPSCVRPGWTGHRRPRPGAQKRPILWSGVHVVRCWWMCVRTTASCVRDRPVPRRLAANYGEEPISPRPMAERPATTVCFVGRRSGRYSGAVVGLPARLSRKHIRLLLLVPDSWSPLPVLTRRRRPGGAKR